MKKKKQLINFNKMIVLTLDVDSRKKIDLIKIALCNSGIKICFRKFPIYKENIVFVFTE